MKGEDLIVSSIIIGEHLIDAEAKLYQTRKGKEIDAAAKKLTHFLTQAIAQNDIPVIFELERQAIERDITCYGAEERRTSALASLEQAVQLVRMTSSPEGAKTYLVSMSGGKIPKAVPASDLVQNFIRNQKTQLTQMIGDTASPALKLYRACRKEALEHIRREYVRNLNRGLGRKRGKDKGLSR